MKTLFPKENEPAWHLVDADGQVLGRLASEIATLLRGKHKPSYTPHMDNGDFVVVVNADKIVLTANKKTKKMYYHHTGWPGGMKSISAGEQLQSHPERLIKDAVWGMLPKNALNRDIFKKLKVYGGGEHPHKAQKPVTYEPKKRY